MKRIVKWLKSRIVEMPINDSRTSLLLILFFWAITTMPAVIYAISNPTGATLLSKVIDLGKMVAFNGLLFIVTTIVVGIVLSCMYVPLPRLCVGSFVYTNVVNVFILYIDNSGTFFSYLVGIIFSIVVLVIGLLFILLMYKQLGRRILLLSIVILTVGSTIYLLIGNQSNIGQTLQVSTQHLEPVKDENPAIPGAFKYAFLSYGSGDDIQREVFGKSADEITPAVDASDFITKWDEKRVKFWGFDPSNLPINGRVWLPEGAGPFPIMLMVHGNHTMEEFSTDGYDYLGELFASRGFIAISVDEDFINYSNVSGSPNNNYELRAWMVIQHLIKLQKMNIDPKSMFYQKIDFGQVALMGHSRGGQAMPMVTDYKTFFEDDDELINSMDEVDIKAVVAVAPTDKTINDKNAKMNNVSYLLLGGARDADVSDFRGDRQFHRTTFDQGDEGFKTSLYIAEANHTQFNTSWGTMDLSVPRGLFLNHRQTLKPVDQQEIAKVYMSAFLEVVFHDNTSLKELFKDYRYGREWLPEATLVNKYQDATYAPIVQYQRNKSDGIDVEGFKSWKVKNTKDRQGKSHLSDALELEWNAASHYTIDLSKSDVTTRAGLAPKDIVLTMANVDSEAEQRPDIDIELETTDGVNVTFPLDRFFPFPQVITTDYTVFGLFDSIFRDGKYEASWEPIFQTFIIPIDPFEQENEAFDIGKISKLVLHFNSGSGKILVEEIGVR